MKLFLHSASTSIWVLIRSVAGVLLNKIISISFGYSGIVLFSHFQSIVGAVLIVFQEGFNQGMISLLKKDIIDKENVYPQKAQSIIATTFYSSLIAYLFFLLLSLIFAKQYMFDTFSIDLYSSEFILIAFGLLGVLAFYFFGSVLLAKEKVHTYNLFGIISTLSVLLLAAFSCKYLKLSYFILIVVFGGALMGFVLSVYVIGFKKQKLSLQFDKKYIKPMLNFLMMAISIAFISKMADILIRQYAMQQYTSKEVALWQVLQKISEYGTTALLAVLSVIYFPQLPSLLHDTIKLKKFIYKTLSIFFPLITIVIIMEYIFSKQLITILFDTKYAEASSWFYIQLIADYFKYLSMFLMYIVKAQEKTFYFVCLEACSVLILFFSIVILSQFKGITCLFWAQVIQYTTYLSILVFMNRKYIL
jgi:PST family polysaccharide transporter